MIEPYKLSHKSSLIESYIETFAAEPWNEVWQPEWVGARIDWVAQVPNFIGWVSVKEGRVVGAILGYAKPFKDRYDFEILELFVLPGYQNKGLGKELMFELERSLSADQANSFGVIHLLTAKQTASERFYQRLGYEMSERLGFMAKRLNTELK